MNRMIEKPTHIIEIYLEKDSDEENYDNKIDKTTAIKIDFYNMCNNKEPEKNSQLEFYITAFKNDLRIREFHSSETQILIDFWTVNEAISFYRQHYKKLKMEFKNNWNIRESLSILNDFSTNQVNLVGKINEMKFLDDQWDCQLKPVEEEIKNDTEKCFKKTTNHFLFNVQSNDDFLKKVRYFESLKNDITKTDIEIIENSKYSELQDFIQFNIKEIAVGIHSNLFLQSKLNIMNDKELEIIIKNLGTDISAISATKYGAYTVQKLINRVKSPLLKTLLAQQFKENGKYLIWHEIGNYSIQKLLKYNEPLITDLFTKNIGEIKNYKLGVKILNKTKLLYNKI
ncbi:hypothetical protein NUSPORA_00809 [Nucleospora cyclopteri]